MVLPRRNPATDSGFTAGCSWPRISAENSWCIATALAPGPPSPSGCPFAGRPQTRRWRKTRHWRIKPAFCLAKLAGSCEPGTAGERLLIEDRAIG